MFSYGAVNSLYRLTVIFFINYMYTRCCKTLITVRIYLFLAQVKAPVFSVNQAELTSSRRAKVSLSVVIRARHGAQVENSGVLPRTAKNTHRRGWQAK